MGLEKDDHDTDQTSEDDLAAQAAFDESYDGTASTPAVEKSEDKSTTEKAEEKQTAEAPPAAAPTKEPEAATPATEPPATEAAPTAPSPKPDDQDLRLEVRKLHGRIGALNDQLQNALKKNEAEGKPAVLSEVQLSRLKGEYPELADLLKGDIADVISGLAQHKADPKEIESIVSSRVEKEIFKMRTEAVEDVHPTWATDCWETRPAVQTDGSIVEGKRKPIYQAWLNTMTADEASAFENSQSPAFVNRKLSEFYAWKEKAAKAETEKQQRLKAAVTPQGTPRAGPQTVPDEEAERKAFEEEFNR